MLILMILLLKHTLLVGIRYSILHCIGLYYSLFLFLSLFSLSLFLQTVRIWSITEPDPQCIRCIKISTHQPVMSLSYSEVSDSTIHNTKSI